MNAWHSSTHIVCAYSLVINKKKELVELKLGYNNRDPRVGPLDYPSALKVCIKIITITKALIRPKKTIVTCLLQVTCLV